ncbi:hypothetical protein B0J13DRAFT_585588 [Dactylonectria estremocensis]|uniref:Rhodopsin domain-containing protein n=1 Tax=Dactylonectria estremocensis TaxID=1079267 RepID=A0A9P9J473_9HYPO|nr:hypothetical protein B0J13DRAFT_585588 [Dactylonectria estremocensis]
MSLDLLPAQLPISTIVTSDLFDKHRYNGDGGDGPWAVAVTWVLTVVVLVFVILRIYTRAIIVKWYGTEDHVYNMSDISNPQDVTQSVLFECISQKFNVLGMATAKWSLGLFFLRIVKQTWHNVAIWAALSLLMGASISCLFCFWFQFSPPAYLWDQTIFGGKCEVDQLPVSIILEKDSVGIIVWSAAEVAVTMVCIGIPICRPLHKKYLDKWTSKDGSKYKANTAGGLGADRKLGLNGPCTKSYVIRGRFLGDNQSEEEIQGPNFLQSQQRRSDDDGLEKGILVTEGYQVTSSRARRRDE